MTCDCPVCKIVMQDMMEMVGQSVGSIIDPECHRPPPNPICLRCIQLEGIIRMKDEQLKERNNLILEFLEGWTTRTASMESALLARFSRLIGYKDITG